MDYRVAFDASRTWPDLSMAAFGVLLMVLGLVDARALRRIPGGEPQFSFLRPSPYVTSAVGALMVVVLVVSASADWLAARRALRDGRVVIVEGIVEDFIPMPEGGHAEESFMVAGHRFQYGDGGPSARFAFPAVRGGPIAAGQHVRIHARGASILKLEIAATDAVRTRPAPVSNHAISNVLVLLSFGVVAWIAIITWVLPRFTGWSDVAKRRTGPLPLNATSYAMQSVKLGPVAYQQVVTVSIGDAAFGLVPLPTFALWHAPIVIPFSEVGRVERSHEFGMEAFDVYVEGEARPIRMYGKSGDAVARAFASSDERMRQSDVT